VFASERVTLFKTRVYDDLCGFDPVDRVGCADKIEKSKNGLKFEEFRSFARTRVGSDSNNTRRLAGKPATPGDGGFRAENSGEIAETASRDPQERPLIPHDKPGRAPKRGEVRGEAVPTGTTQRLRGAEDPIHADVQADGTSEEGKNGGMLGLHATTGRESTFSRVRGENARPILAAARAQALFPALASGAVARAVRESMSLTRKRFLPYPPEPECSAPRTSSRVRVTSNPRGFIASPSDPLPPATHEHALTTIPRRANYRAAERTASGIFERARQRRHSLCITGWVRDGASFPPQDFAECGARARQRRERNERT